MAARLIFVVPVQTTISGQAIQFQTGDYLDEDDPNYPPGLFTRLQTEFFGYYQSGESNANYQPQINAVQNRAKGMGQYEVLCNYIIDAFRFISLWLNNSLASFRFLLPTMGKLFTLKLETQSYKVIQVFRVFTIKCDTITNRAKGMGQPEVMQNYFIDFLKWFYDLRG